MKNIFCIRHGLAFHNIKAMEIGSDAYLMEECFDAPLVEKGIQQAKDLGKQWKRLNAVQIVFVSPLTRTLQTCQEIFQAHPGVKIIAHDKVKEYPQGLQICNKRREKLELEKQFSGIDFQGWNRKLTKCGGIIESRKLKSFVRESSSLKPCSRDWQRPISRSSVTVPI